MAKDDTKKTPSTPKITKPFENRPSFNNPMFQNRPNLPKFNNSRVNSSFRTQSRGSGGK